MDWMNSMYFFFRAFLVGGASIGTPGALLVALNIIAVDELAGDGIVGMGNPLSLRRDERYLPSTTSSCPPAAQAADGGAVFLEVEVVE